MKNNNIMKLITFFNLFVCILFSQEQLDRLIENVLSGSKDSARVYLPVMEKQYPYNPNMLFLKGLMTTDGEEAMRIFVELYNHHPSSKYGDDAVMKVAEYYYASGLYIQSAEWLKKMPIFYSRSEHIERAIKLFLNSLIVSGHRDTAIFYSQVFQRQFPSIDIDEKISGLLSGYDNSMKKKEKNNKSNPINNQKQSISSVEPPKKKIIKEKKTNKYSLQSGAYGLEKNAEKQKNVLKNGGFDARVNKISKKTKTLYIVRIGFFETKADAEKKVKQIKLTLDIDTIVITNK